MLPAHQYGFKDHAQEIFTELRNYRTQGIEVSLPEFLVLWGKDKLRAGTSTKLNDVAYLSGANQTRVALGDLSAVSETNLDELKTAFLHDLGVADLGRVRVEDLIGTREMAGLLNEVVRDALIEGYSQAPISNDLIAIRETYPQREITVPRIDLDSRTAAQEVAEGETLPMGSASYGDRSIKAKKFGVALEITYEVIYFATVDILKLFVARQGYLVGTQVDSEFCTVMLDGDQADNSMSAPVLGVDTIVSNITYADLIHWWTHMSLRDVHLDSIIANQANIELMLNLAEFKTPVQGEPLVQIEKQNIDLPRLARFYTKSSLTDAQVIILDRKKAAIKYDVRPPLIENDLNIINETKVAKLSFYVGIAKMFRDAAIVIDKSHADSESGYDFSDYAYMAALDTAPSTI
jgi:hypothetical protein